MWPGAPRSVSPTSHPPAAGRARRIELTRDGTAVVASTSAQSRPRCIADTAMNTILLMLVAHGGGSTAQTTWGHLLPELARKHHVIAPEMQGHGHTADIDRPFSFEQMADDTAALLEQLGVREGFALATPENMPAPLREAYLAAAPHPDLARFVAKSVKMMQTFKDVPGVVLVEHEAKLARLV